MKTNEYQILDKTTQTLKNTIGELEKIRKESVNSGLNPYINIYLENLKNVLQFVVNYNSCNDARMNPFVDFGRTWFENYLSWTNKVLNNATPSKNTLDLTYASKVIE